MLTRSLIYTYSLVNSVYVLFCHVKKKNNKKTLRDKKQLRRFRFINVKNTRRHDSRTARHFRVSCTIDITIYVPRPTKIISYLYRLFRLRARSTIGTFTECSANKYVRRVQYQCMYIHIII